MIYFNNILKKYWTNRLSLTLKMLFHQLLDMFTDLMLLIVKIISAYIESVINLFINLPKKDVRNQVVLITGSGHGLGREMALIFSKLGAKLALIDINQVSYSLFIHLGREGERERENFFLILKQFECQPNPNPKWKFSIELLDYPLEGHFLDLQRPWVQRSLSSDPAVCHKWMGEWVWGPFEEEIRPNFGRVWTLFDIHSDIMSSKLQENNERVVEEIRSGGGIAFSYLCDITNEESIAEIAKQIKWDLGEVDILISNLSKKLIN